jgi:hypothetical protein
VIAALLMAVSQQAVPVETLALEGPLTAVRLELPGMGSTELRLNLVRGESLRLSVPLPAGALVGAGVWAVEGGGTANATGVAALARPSSEPLRGRPPAPGGSRTLPIGALAALLAGAAAVAGLRRKLGQACLASVLAAAGALLLGSAGGSPPDLRVRVLDGELGVAAWTLTDGVRGELEISAWAGAQVWSEPEGRPWHWRGELSEPAGKPRWWLELERAASWVRAELRPGMRVLAPELNGWGKLDAVWSRSDGAPWAFHGAWEQGQALPEARAESDLESLPSWLAGGLPAGRGALLARLAAGTFGGPGRPYEVWLRLVLR